MILYHATCPWDTFHIGVGGGTLYGNLVLGSGATLTSDLRTPDPDACSSGK